MFYGKKFSDGGKLTEGLIHLTPKEIEQLESGEELSRITQSSKGTFRLTVRIERIGETRHKV